MNTFTIWQPLLISGLLALVVLWYIWRSLFGDRARHGPRCLRCGHPFAESQDLTCVECGWTARRRADLVRPRRHWGQAALGTTMLLGGAWILRMQTTGEHPAHYLPDGILVRLFPLGPGGDDFVQTEIARRLNEDELSPSSRRTMVRRLLAGDGTARPADIAWQARYGGLLDRWRQAYASPGNPLTPELLRLPADVSIELATRWIADDPIPASMALQDWWPPGTEVVADLRWASRPTDPPLHSVGYRNDASIARRHHFLLPPATTWPDPPVVEIAFREPRFLRLGGERLPEPIDASATPTPATTTVDLPRPIDFSGPVLAPWAGDDLSDEAITEMFRPGLQRWPDADERPYAMRFNPRHLARDAFDGILFGFIVEVIEQAPGRAPQIHRRTRIWTLGGTPETTGRRIGWDISEEATEALDGAFDPDSQSTWFIRVTGDETVARLGLGLLADSETMSTYDAWWSGSITLDLSTATSSGAPFRRMWFDPGGVRTPTPRSSP